MPKAVSSRKPQTPVAMQSAATHQIPSSSIPTPAVAPTSTSALTRWKEIADSVQNDIEAGLLSVGDLLPSETALTEKWKVSRMTAHRAMQELQRSGLVTRQRGRGTLVAGKSVKTTGNVALLFHNPLDLLEIEYIRGINLGLADEYQLVLCDSGADIEQEARHLQRMQEEADGIICMPSCDLKNTPLLRKIVEANYPLVCVDRVPQDLEIEGVTSDNYGASRAALLELHARGHRRIAHFTQDELHISTVEERHRAFCETLREIGEPNPQSLVRFIPSGTPKNFEIRVQIMHDALFTLRHQADPPTTVFCLHDYCLTVLLAAMERLGLRVPQDMEVLSFHDTLTLMPSVSSRLHRIVQQPRLAGQMAAERLKRLMTEPHLPSQITRVPVHIYSPHDSNSSPQTLSGGIGTAVSSGASNGAPISLASA